MGDKLHLVACQNLEREIRAILEKEKSSEVEVEVVPTQCHKPVSQKEASETIHAHHGDRDVRPIGCGLLAEIANPALSAQRCPQRSMDQCFFLVANRELIEGWMREGAFLLTPGWLSRWQDYLGYWAFDQATARDFFRESATRLLLLDTGVDPQSAERLREFAEFVARPFQIVPIGLDFLRHYLRTVVLEWRLDSQNRASKIALDEVSRKLGDYAMMYDLMGSMTGMKSEVRVIDGIFEVFTMLFAPAELNYLPIFDGKPGVVRSMTGTGAAQEDIANRLAGQQQPFSRTSSGKGFVLRIGETDRMAGVLEMDGIAFPQYLAHYLNLALNLARVCDLAILNARMYEQIGQNLQKLETSLAERERLIAQLQEAMANVRLLSGLLPICAGCKKIRDDRGYWNQIESYISQHTDAKFSHGLCPECVPKYFPGIEV